MNMIKDKLLCSLAYNWHDSSVSFALGTKIILVLEAERIFQKKKKLCNKEEMEYLVKYGLKLLKKQISDIDYWTMTTLNNPYLNIDDIVNKEEKTVKEPHWKKITMFGFNKNVLIINHHLAHAGIYLATKFKKAVIISCDGGGDFNPETNTEECLVTYLGNKNAIIKQNLKIDFISGKTYRACSTFIYGHTVHEPVSSEGKLMALAGFGKINNEYYHFLKQNFIKIEKANYTEILNILENSMPALKGQATLQTKNAKDFAATVQNFFVKKRLENINSIMKSIPANQEAIILTGGASLNLDLNTMIMKKYPNIKHFIAPCCDDTGQSLGALSILITKIFNLRPEVNFPYLGEGCKEFNYTIETLDQAVDILLKNGILILHNGKSEIGPRALGNRSFIARPDNLEVKKKLSEKIKQRESYRPVAPIVLEDKVSEYFIGPKKSPYMLYLYKAVESKVNKVIGAIHTDNSARVQTVNYQSNPFLYDLIKKFGERTGIYALLNTSLNLQGNPIANKIEESQDIYEKIPAPKCIIYNGTILKKSE